MVVGGGGGMAGGWGRQEGHNENEKVGGGWADGERGGGKK